MEQPTILLGKAIEQMRASTLRGVPFSFSFCSYNKDKGTSKGIVHVPVASIRSKSKEGSILLQYFDETEAQPKQCYIPLLHTFNGQKIIV